MARCLWELSKSGKIRVVDIYRQMAFGNQTDKEFAIGGSAWRKYVTTNRILNLALSKETINDIIAPGCIERLRPERRFDQTLYFTMRTQDFSYSFNMPTLMVAEEQTHYGNKE